MLPGIPSPTRLTPDDAPTAYVPHVRPVPAVESIPRDTATPSVEAGPDARVASHVRPEPPTPSRTMLPWVVFAVVAVLVVTGTTIWSSTLHVPATPVESLIGASTTPVATSIPTATPQLAAPVAPRAVATTTVRAPTVHRVVVPRVPRVVAPPPPPAPVPPPVFTPVFPTVLPTTAAAAPTTTHSKKK